MGDEKTKSSSTGALMFSSIIFVPILLPLDLYYAASLEKSLPYIARTAENWLCEKAAELSFLSEFLAVTFLVLGAASIYQVVFRRAYGLSFMFFSLHVLHQIFISIVYLRGSGYCINQENSWRKYETASLVLLFAIIPLPIIIFQIIDIRRKHRESAPLPPPPPFP